MKQITTILVAIAGLAAIMLWGAPAVAVDNIEVLKIETMLMEKGADNVSLTVKAFVKNNGEPADVAINVVALDGEGFEMEKLTVSGSLKAAQTKVLVGIVKVPSDIFEKIVKWEWKK